MKPSAALVSLLLSAALGAAQTPKNPPRRLELDPKEDRLPTIE